MVENELSQFDVLRHCRGRSRQGTEIPGGTKDEINVPIALSAFRDRAQEVLGERGLLISNATLS